MVKTVFVEDVAQKCIEIVADRATSVVGLVIGQCGRDQEVVYVVHVVRIPLESVGGGDDDDEKKKKKMWDIDLVVQHAKQVTRMLLGGFDVLGMFVCTPTEQLSTDSLAACRKAISEIRSMQVNSPVPSCSIASSTTERLLLQVSRSPRKFSWKTMNVASTLASAEVVDHKVVTSTRWIRLQCRLAIDETIRLSREQSAFDLAKQIRVGLDPLRLAIEDSIHVIEGHMKDEGEKLELGGGGGGGNRRDRKANRQQQQQQGPSILNVDFLLNTNSSNPEPCRLTTRQCDVTMHIRGTVQCRTHVPSSSTVGDAIKCLKLDVLRSLIGRCEIHCEDLMVIDDEQLDRLLVHELPCRIFAPLSPGGITVSDFLFPGEQAGDSLDAFDELLDISPSTDDIEVACERPSESSDRTPSPVDERQDTGVSVQEMLPPKPPQSCNYIFLGLTVGVALVAGATSFYVLQH